MDLIQGLINMILGLFAGTYGSLIGAGGGFVMSPILLIFYGMTPQTAAATSLTAVVFNAITAVITYHQQGRIDYFTGIRFAAATIPGALIGTVVGRLIPVDAFKLFFGLVLVIIASYLAIRGERPAGRASGQVVDEALLRSEGKTVRRLTDATGREVVFGYRMRDGLLLSGGIGMLSSILGVGGGIIATPAMISLFGVPAHFAVATSQFILLISSLTGAASYLAQGVVDIPTAVLLGIGGIGGAKLGAELAKRMKGKLIVRLLAIGLLITGLRLLASGVHLF